MVAVCSSSAGTTIGSGNGRSTFGLAVPPSVVVVYEGSTFCLGIPCICASWPDMKSSCFRCLVGRICEEIPVRQGQAGLV
jgi:hypothetical protein